MKTKKYMVRRAFDYPFVIFVFLITIMLFSVICFLAQTIEGLGQIIFLFVSLSIVFLFGVFNGIEKEDFYKTEKFEVVDSE